MMKIGLALDFCQLSLERLLRGNLHSWIERRVNKESTIIDLILRQQQSQIPLDRVHRIIFLDEGQTFRMRCDFRYLRLLGLCRRKILQLNHAIQNGITLDRRAVGVLQRRKTIGTSNQAGKERGLGKVQLGCALSEISLRGCFNAITTSAEINAINVKLEDLLLGELTFDAQSHHCFEQFPTHGAAAQRKAVARELLGNAAGSFLGRATQDIVSKCAENAAPINPSMLIEASVLARQHRSNK